MIKEYKLEEIQADLRIKLNYEKLPPEQVLEGIQQCFVICHIQFVKTRQPDISESAMGTYAAEVVDDLLTEQGLTKKNLTPVMLNQMVTQLDAQFEFMTDPTIRKVHSDITEALITRLGA